MTTCPACRWENDADTGSCAGCGRDLAGVRGAVPAPVPEPRPYPEDTRPHGPTPAPEPEPEPPVIHRVAEPVLIRPQTRPVLRTVEPSRDGPRTVDPARAPRPVETGPREPAAIRDIPVVVAPAASRPAVRFRDNVVTPDAGLPVSAPAALPVGPGTRLCPSCGTAVESTRRFCRCGARLSTEVVRARAGEAAAEGWTTVAFRRAQRAANDGRRVRYDAALAARTYLLRALLVTLLVLVIASQAPPWGADVRQWVQTRVEQSLPGQ